MKKTVVLFFTFLLYAVSFGQSATQDLYVAFDTSVVFSEREPYIATLSNAIEGFDAIQQQYNFSFEKGITISEERLVYLEQQALKISGDASAVRKLRNILRLSVENATDDILASIARELENLEGVTYCSFVSLEPVKPPYDIPPKTPDFEPLQTYLNPNPGVNMHYAWSLGLSGDGIDVRNIEYGMNVHHEELHQINAYIAPGMTVHSSLGPDWTEHGTATAGVVFAHRGEYGVSGMAHGANEFVLFPEYTEENGYNRVHAVSQAINNTDTGHVILYEMQTGGASGNPDDYVPAEYSLPIWNLTKAATDAGIVIVAAAGNGNQNLDNPMYAHYMNRGDSGAIIVGAGTANLQHSKLWFSTYGSRVDVQGWGQNVLTTGYGDWAQIGNDFDQNYTMFSGTSSATPVVASCAIVLQSYYHSITGNYLTSQELRDILIATGTSQGAGGHIGPLPEMQNAINHINNSLSIPDFARTDFMIYPNPVQNEMTIVAHGAISDKAKVEIYNIMGQLMYKDDFANERKIDISSFQSGIYFVHLINDTTTTTKKIIKK